MRRSPPTSSSVSRVKPKRTSRKPCVWWKRRDSRPHSPSSIRRARHSGSRNGAGAARRVQDRFERLVALQERITEENLKTFEGRDVEVMVTGASGKKDAATHRVTGREKTGVLVHVGVPEGEPMPQVAIS